jgi:acetyl-CoA C-acetyltransferase
LTDPPEVVIAGAARTPFGAFGGALRDLTHPELAHAAGEGALARAGLAPAAVELLVLGVNFPGSDRSIARQAQLRIGIPEESLAFTVDRACCSSLTAISRARQSLLLGEAEVALAGGAENLSRVPYFVHDARWGRRLGPITLDDQLVISCPYTGVPRAVKAAAEAERFGFTRRDQDEWALRSQRRAAAADADGRFAAEIVPCGDLERDESIRAEATIEDLERLAPVYDSETVTAGNAPGLSTGAACLALCASGAAEVAGRPRLATILASAMAAGHPQHLASMPAVAARRALASAGVAIEQVDLIEINEAFAVVPLVTTEILAGESSLSAADLRERTNVNGGAIALGHPTGASGARLVLTLCEELRRRGGGIGLATICGGIGEAEAVLIRVDP